MWAGLFVLMAAWLALANIGTVSAGSKDPNGPPPKSGQDKVFDDKWENWSWGAKIKKEKDWPIYKGKPSLSVQFYEEWGAASFAKSKGFSTNGYTHLQFMMHPNGGGIPSLQAALHGSDGKIIKMVPVVYYATPDKHGWFSVSIPLKDLGAIDKKITRVTLQQRNSNTISFNLAALDFAKEDGKKKHKDDGKKHKDDGKTKDHHGKKDEKKAPEFVAPVFDDKVLWDNWSWDTKSYVKYGPAYDGKALLAVKYEEPWAGLSYHADGFVSGYSSLKFAMHPNGGPVPSLRAIVYDKSGEIGNIHVTQFITDIKNGWFEVSVPLSKLGASEKEITRVAIQDGTGSEPLYTFHLDDLKFSRP